MLYTQFTQDFDYLKQIYQNFLKYYDDTKFADEVIPVIFDKSYVQIQIKSHNSDLIDFYCKTLIYIYKLFVLQSINKVKIEIFDRNNSNHLLWYHDKNNIQLFVVRNKQYRNLFVNIIEKYMKANTITEYEFNDDYSELYKKA